MTRKVDSFVGKVFGELTVIQFDRTEKRQSGGSISYWKLSCKNGHDRISKKANIIGKSFVCQECIKEKAAEERERQKREKAEEKKPTNSVIWQKLWTNRLGFKHGKLTLKSFTMNGRNRTNLKFSCECGNTKTYLDGVSFFRTITRNPHYMLHCGCENKKIKRFIQHTPTSLPHAKWAKAVKSVGACDICSSTQSLHAHHIISKHTHPHLSGEVANGVCICERCHMHFHSIYGIECDTMSYIIFKLNKQMGRI